MSAPARNDAEAIPFTELRSRVPNVAHRAAKRFDPFWQSTWDSGSLGAWVDRATAELLLRAGLGSTWRDSRYTPEGAYEMILRGNSFRRRRLQTLAAIGMWRTCTTDQINAIVGTTQSDRRVDDLSLLFQADMVARGSIPSVIPNPNLPDLYRPTDSPTVDRLLTEGVDYETWLAVTAGKPWTVGTQHARHNILATELALRIAEFCDVGAVAGERVCAHSDLLPAGVERASADAVAVREDGMLLALELTASAKTSFVNKLERWAEGLAADPDWPICVVFVVADQPNTRWPVYGETRRAIEKVVSTPGRGGHRLAERMAIVHWQDWFPAAHQASDNFPILPAFQFSPGSQWSQVNLLDIFDMPFEADNQDSMIRLVDRANALWGAPHWLRDDERSDQMFSELVAEATASNPLSDLAKQPG